MANQWQRFDSVPCPTPTFPRKVGTMATDEEIQKFIGEHFLEVDAASFDWAGKKFRTFQFDTLRNASGDGDFRVTVMEDSLGLTIVDYEGLA